jgi:hypothetical protein
MPLSGGDGPDSNARFSMDDRQRILAAIAGTPTDRLPWVLRMDLRLVAQRAPDLAEPTVLDPLAGLHRRMGAGTTVWGGFPSVSPLDDSMSEPQLAAYVDSVFDARGTGERLNLSVSGNVPPDANIERLARSPDRVVEFSPVIPVGLQAR